VIELMVLILTAMVMILGVLTFSQDQRVRKLERALAGSSDAVGVHSHEWGPWQEWGITYQQRKCKGCGFAQLEEQKTSKGKNQ